jgi:hypothetical protein
MFCKKSLKNVKRNLDELNSTEKNIFVHFSADGLLDAFVLKKNS